jgi:putative ABC transport system permease protein
MIWLAIAWRNVFRNWHRSLFTVLVAGIGGIAILMTVGYMLSAFVAVREGAIRGGLGHLQIANVAEFEGYSDVPLQHGLGPDDVERVRAAALAMDPEVIVMPRLELQGVASSGERSVIFLGDGVSANDERRFSRYYSGVAEGKGLERVGDVTQPAVIGHEMARLLGVRIGDSITLLSPTVTGGLNAVDVEVVGLLKTGVPLTDRTRVVLPLELAKTLLRSGKVNRIVLGLDKAERTQQVRDSLAARLGGLEIKTWSALAVFYHQLVDIYVRQFSVLGLIIMTVVVLTFSNAVLLSVIERTREIGTLAALGIRRRYIRLQFVLEGLLLGGAGGGLAVIAGALLMMALNALQIQMPAPPGQTEGYPLHFTFSTAAAFSILVGNMVLGVLSAFLASSRVTRLNLLSALQHV